MVSTSARVWMGKPVFVGLCGEAWIYGGRKRVKVGGRKKFEGYESLKKMKCGLHVLVCYAMFFVMLML